MNSCKFLPVVFDLGRDLQLCILVVFIEIAPYEIITDVHLGRGKEKYISEDTAEAPHILVFQVAAVRPAVDFGGQQVLARLEVIGDVELSRRHASLAVPDPRAVQPQVEGRLHTGKMKKDLAPFPFGRYLKSAPV